LAIIVAGFFVGRGDHRAVPLPHKAFGDLQRAKLGSARLQSRDDLQHGDGNRNDDATSTKGEHGFCHPGASSTIRLPAWR
jgi:hypothetical protein